MLSFAIHRHAALGSTSDEARRLLAEGAPEGTVVTAEEQIAGRGRQGHRWASPPGNLYLSVVLRPDLAPSRWPELGFVAGLAVAEALAALLPPDAASSLKWPNDVLIGGAKVAGMLIEREADAAILGIGVNVAHHPADTPYPATDLRAAGAAVAVDTVRDQVLAALAACLMLWEDRGFAAVREAWLARAHPVGTALAARLGDDTRREGRFAGLGPDGALLLDTDEGRIRIVAGEVVAPRTPP
ncbi:MAG: biotin--[acetyl-CoA-carboxylase] ligase [Rhodospirillales bacterium]|nr:biotin--[acetyl-CoA-carboxylase] ligase [Rhodospirillales bacterium]